jgi:hypothetical protein
MASARILHSVRFGHQASALGMHTQLPDQHGPVTQSTEEPASSPEQSLHPMSINRDLLRSRFELPSPAWAERTDPEGLTFRNLLISLGSRSLPVTGSNVVRAEFKFNVNQMQGLNVPVRGSLLLSNMLPDNPNWRTSIKQLSIRRDQLGWALTYFKGENRGQNLAYLITNPQNPAEIQGEILVASNGQIEVYPTHQEPVIRSINEPLFDDAIHAQIAAMHGTRTTVERFVVSSGPLR